MVMLKIKDMNDFESLPITKWNIRQPDDDGNREDASDTGESRQKDDFCFDVQNKR